MSSTTTLISSEAIGANSSATVTRAIEDWVSVPTLGTNNACIADNKTFTGNWFISQIGSTQSRFTGNVGVGMDPVRKLDVTGTFGATGAATFGSTVDATRFTSSSSSAANAAFAVSSGNGLFNSGTNQIGFTINSSLAATLSSTGLAIGTTPVTKLTVRGVSSFDNGASGGAAQLLGTLAASTGTNFGQIGNTGARWSLGYGSSQSTLGTEVLIWDSSGNVGIGTAPNDSLHIQPPGGKGITIKTTTTDNPLFQLLRNSTYGWNFSCNGNAATAFAKGGNGFQFLSDGGNTLLTISDNGNFAIGSAALSTSATNGFFYMDTCAGTPTGTPTTFTGRVAMVYDTTNNKFYIYNGAWKSVTLA